MNEVRQCALAEGLFAEWLVLGHSIEVAAQMSGSTPGRGYFVVVQLLATSIFGTLIEVLAEAFSFHRFGHKIT